MPTIATGLKISVSNTPQAKDDVYGGMEEFSQLLDVLCNDLGGAAKSLYSLSKDLTIEDGGTVTSASMISAVPVQTITTNLGSTATIVDGKISYSTNGLDYLGEGDTATDTFSYIIRLSSGAFSIATVTITLTGSNDAPVLDNPIADHHSDEDQPVSYQVPADAFSDVDGDALTYSATLAGGGDLPSWLSFDATTRTFSGTPPQDFNGTISLEVTASDGTLSATDTFDLVIDPVNDDPTTAPVTLAAIAEDSGTVTITQADLLANAADVDGDALSATGLTLVGAGTLIDNGDGSWDFTPAPDDDTGVSFTYSIVDGNGGSVAGSASLDLTPVDDAPMETRVNDAADDRDFDLYTDVAALAAVAMGTTNGTNAADLLVGTNQAGTETINGNNGNDIIHGAGGNDTINGNNNDDTLYGGTGDDTISGGGGNDVIYGGSGHDTLNGDGANETIYGGSGNDNIRGSAGTDQLWGGTGQDDFIFAVGDSTVASPDQINDFSHAEDDNIDLTAFANFTATDWQGVLASPAALTAGSLGYVVNLDGSLTVYGDHDGNGVADFAVDVVGVGSLQANDFIFGGP